MKTRTDSPTDKFYRDMVDILTNPALMPLHVEAARALIHPERMTGIERAVMIVAGPEKEVRA